MALEIKIISDETTYRKMIRAIKFDLGDGRILEMEKNEVSDDEGGEYENDMVPMTVKDEELWNSLSDEEQEDIQDFIP